MLQRFTAKAVLFFLVLQLVLPFMWVWAPTTYASVDASYDFNSDTIGSTPADITAANGTFETTNHATQGQSMSPVSSSGWSIAIADLDLIPSSTNSSVTWKETYTTAGRGGMMLRASGSNSTALWTKQWYLFQASPSNGSMRIYSSTSSSYPILSNVSVSAPGVNTPRWYRATASWTTLTFEYSDDGVNYTTAGNITDSTHTGAWTVQFLRWYGGSVTGTHIDDIEFDDFGIPTPPASGPILAYDFESDTSGSPAASVTMQNGTANVLTHSTQGQWFSTLTASSGNSAVADLDLIPSLQNYSITWKDTYESGKPTKWWMILRGTGSNSQNSGAMQWYLFQARPSDNKMRIFVSTSSSYVSLTNTTISAPWSDIPRWYRATASGSTLTFEYSDDGVSYTVADTVTDSTYLGAGQTQYARWYGEDIDGGYVDDIYYEDLSGTPPASGSVSIANLNEYQVVQRTWTWADLVVSGTYTGTPISIEASFNGWAFAVVDASPTGGTFSGTLANQNQWQGTLTVRHSNDTSLSGSIDNIGIGDIFIISGQSNASGRGTTNNNTYSHPILKATLFWNDDTWKDLVDPVDSNAGQVDSVSSDGWAAWTPWTQVATQIMAAEGVPVAFVPTPKWGTRTSQWQPNASTSTLYGSMARRINEVGGTARANLWFQGESDSTNGTTEATYETELTTIVDTISTDFGGLKTIVGQIGHSNFAGNDTIRKAQVDVINTSANALAWPVTYDIDLSDGDTLHFRTDDEMAELARRWYEAIDATIYGGADGYGPILDNANLEYDSGTNTVTVPFNETLSGSSSVGTGSFDLKNNGVSVDLSAVTLSGSTVEIIPTSPLNTVQSMTLSYASLNDGVDAAIYDVNSLPAQPFYDETIALAVSVPSEAPGGVLTNLGLWYKADAPWASIADETSVVAWQEQASGNTSFTPQSVARAPSYESSDTDANFNPYFDFDRSTLDRLNGPNLGLTGTPDYQMYFVYNQTDHAGGQFPDLWDWDGVNNEERIEAFNNNFQWSTLASPAPEGTWNIGVAWATSGVTSGRANGLSSAGNGSFFGGFNGNGNVSIGTNGQLNANIAEIIYYSSEDTGTDRQRVESYLALKYGITLDQTTPTDYLSSAGTGTLMWDSSVSSFNNDIAGIGRDSGSDLDQRISKSVNDDALVMIATTNDFASANNDSGRTSLDNMSFTSWTNNDGGLVFTTTGAPENRKALNRKWQVQVTGTGQTLYISVPDNSSTEATKLGIENTAVYLLVDTDDNFAASWATAREIPLTLSGSNWIGSVDFADGEYFTFATERSIFPGWVAANIELWFDSSDIDGDGNDANEPNDGDEIATWVNKAGPENATQKSSQSGAIYETDAAEQINGHPLLKFNRVNDGLGSIYEVAGIDFDSTTMTGSTVFTVYKPKTNAGVVGQAVWWNDDGWWDRFFYNYWGLGSLWADGVDDGIVWWVTNAILVEDANAIDEVYLLTTKFAGAGNMNASEVYFNGDSVQQFTENSTTSNLDFHIGWDGDGWAFDGQMAELILYDRVLDECEIEEVNNYLGDKYGRDFSGLTSSFTSVSGYDNDVNAIGIASSSCGGNNEVNTMSSAEVFVDNPSSNDTLDEFMIFSHNGGSVTTMNTIDVPSGVTARQARAWRVEEETSTGAAADLGTVDIEFDLSQLGLTGSWVDSYVLLIDDDGTFTNASTGSTSYTYTWNNKVKFTGVDFDNGDFFAIAVLDTIDPTVMFNQASTQNDPETGTGVVNFTATFSEPIDVASLTCSDISTSGTATVTCTNITEVSGQNVFNVELTATTDGTILTLILPWRITDVAGNDNTLSNSIDNSVTVSGVFDSTPPPVPTINTPTNFNPLTGTGEVGSTITVYSSTWTVIGTGTVSGSGTFSIIPNPIPTIWPVDVTSTDAAGNTSTGTVSTGQIDTTAPSAPTVNTPTNFNPLTGTGEVWAVVSVFSSTWALLGTGTVNSSWEFSITVSPAPTTGPVNINQTDEAGNTSWNTVISTGDIDTTPPANPTVNIPTNFNPLTGTWEIWATVNIYNSGWVLIGTWVVSGSGTFSITPSPIPSSGPVNVEIVDPAGNTGSTSISSGNIDITAPSSPSVSTPTNLNPLTWSWEVGWVVTITNASGAVVGTWVVNGSGSFSVTVSPIPTPLPLNITVVDPAGNTSSGTTVGSGSVDTIQPTNPTVNLPTNFNPITGTWEPWAEVTIFSSTWVIIGTGTVSGSGTFSITPSPIPTTGPVTFTTTDPAGNTSTGATIGTGSIDTTLPVITLSGSNLVIHELSTTYADSWATASDNLDGDITINIVTVNPVVTSSTWSYTITYNVDDASWNSATQVTRTVNVVESSTDSDNDGVPDLIEVEQWTDPTNSGSFLDTDNDSTPNFTDLDDDGDWSVDTIETAAPNGWDFNNDGSLDILQQDVATIVSPINSEYVALDTTTWWSCASTSFNMVAESSLSTQNPRDFPLGLADFNLNCSATGATANIKIYYDRVYDTSSWIYQKYNSTLNTYTDISSIVTYTTELVWSINVTVVNYSVTDGGLYDEDGVADGVIIDPSGPSIIPSLGSPGWRTLACRDPEANNYKTYGYSTPSLCEYDNEVVAIVADSEQSNDDSDTQDSENNSVEDSEIQNEENTTDETVADVIETLELTSKDAEYTLENNYDSCVVVWEMNDSNYAYDLDVFSDLDNSQYASEIIKFSSLGIINGYEDGSFGPTNEMTRTEFLKVVLKTHCLSYDDQNTSDLDYSDVDKDTWQARVIARAQGLEIINGDKTESGIPIFRPDDIISKSEAVKIMMRMSGIQADKPVALGYADIDTDWHIPYVRNGQTLGLFNPWKDGFEFKPNDWVSREDMVDLIHRLLQLYK